MTLRFCADCEEFAEKVIKEISNFKENFKKIASKVTNIVIIKINKWIDLSIDWHLNFRNFS